MCAKCAAGRGVEIGQNGGWRLRSLHLVVVQCAGTLVGVALAHAAQCAGHDLALQHGKLLVEGPRAAQREGRQAHPQQHKHHAGVKHQCRLLRAAGASLHSQRRAAQPVGEDNQQQTKAQHQQAQLLRAVEAQPAAARVHGRVGRTQAGVCGGGKTDKETRG